MESLDNYVLDYITQKALSRLALRDYSMPLLLGVFRGEVARRLGSFISLVSLLVFAALALISLLVLFLGHIFAFQVVCVNSE